MKKILSVLIVLCLSLMLIKAKVYASSSNNGINQVDPSKFSVITNEAGTNGYASLKVTNSEIISIKPGIEYFVLPTYVNKINFNGYPNQWTELPHFTGDSLTIGLYSDSDAIEPVDITKKLYSNSQLVGYAFTINNGANGIKFHPFTLSSSSMTPSEFNLLYQDLYINIDCALLIIEANLIKYLPTTENFDYEAIRGEYDYDISNLYLGEDPTEYAYGIPFYDNLGPVINASVYTYTTKVENPITTTQLIEEIDLVAYDEYDGNLTSEIVVNDVNYRNQVLDKITSQRVLGTYPIIFSVTDSSGNSSSFTIEVIVIDDISPTLDVAASTLSYTREVYIGSLTLQSIQDNVVVTDNHTDNLNITITENQYSGNETKLGTYQIVFEYRDLANNILTVTVTVTIQDTTAPLLVASKTNQSLRYTENLSLLEVFTLMGVNLSDNYDTNITYIILSDNYTGHEVTVGNYTVNLQATDSSGNQSNLTLQIAIFDDIDPIFYIRDNKITVKTTQLLTYDQIDALMQERHLVKNEAYNFEVISDTYTDNATLAGDYTVKVKVTYQNGEVEYQSLNITVKEEVKPTFLMQVWNVIKAIFAFLWKIIKWPFEQLINLF